jgi:hypothetical protein
VGVGERGQQSEWPSWQKASFQPEHRQVAGTVGVARSGKEQSHELVSEVVQVQKWVVSKAQISRL